jgi:hypothetical protein
MPVNVLRIDDERNSGSCSPVPPAGRWYERLSLASPASIIFLPASIAVERKGNSFMQIIVEHGGKTYEGEIATIDSTHLGFEDHNIFSFDLQFECGGLHQGLGAYRLKDVSVIKDILLTVGVSSWESLKGKTVIVLRQHHLIDGITDLSGERFCIFRRG